ncbi:uncharacterized protein MONBRDRAFT_33392 [Monosiga brevicollis MX1]|uniref:Nuclear pore complex protein Nup85 n=1 Tax=Monosiga brevicollis TaxID=81824 RepID=A9V554_MONBE|nr:uncharacterized protein MONBRDRAFT_33392 [Monosiga brevicollis MX1]EDQ87215.1 predicted protein [Monosiga brevicollis MX1]|eukprot:XP_001747828.1 hypothetical protein [Monosiga brevicollis MX1]
MATTPVPFKHDALQPAGASPHYRGPWRKCLAQETHGRSSLSLSLCQTPIIFTALQADLEQLGADGTDEPARLQALLSYSLQYRAALRSIADNVFQHVETTAGLAPAVMEEEARLVQEFGHLEEAWHLCEIFFPRSILIQQAGGFIIPHLLEWLNLHCTELDRELKSILQHQTQLIDQNAAYWTTQMVAAWTDRFDAYPQAQELCRILAAEAGSASYLAKLFPNWLHHVIVYAQYWRPLCRIGEIEDLLLDLGLHVDETDLYLIILQQEPEQTILSLLSHFPTFWSPAHLADLLQRSRWFGAAPRRGAHNMTLREHYVISYALELAREDTLWPLAASYLASCGSVGQATLVEVLESRPQPSLSAVRKSMALARKHGLDITAKRIAICEAKRRQNSGQLDVAVQYFFEAGDLDAVTRIADAMLRTYAATGELDPTDLAQRLGPAVLQSERLTFIAKYKEALALIAEMHYEQAANILINVLSKSTMAPRWLHLHVLLDMLPILEQPDIVFDAEQTQTLMQCLQEVELSHNLREYTRYLLAKQPCHGEEGEKLDEDWDKIPLDQLRTQLATLLEPLRLALARNLARALVVSR